MLGRRPHILLTSTILLLPLFPPSRPPSHPLKATLHFLSYYSNTSHSLITPTPYIHIPFSLTPFSLFPFLHPSLSATFNDTHTVLYFPYTPTNSQPAQHPTFSPLSSPPTPTPTPDSLGPSFPLHTGVQGKGSRMVCEGEVWERSDGEWE